MHIDYSGTFDSEVKLISTYMCVINPFRPTAISKLLEMFGRSTYVLTYLFVTALDSDINQSAGSGGHLHRCIERSL